MTPRLVDVQVEQPASGKAVVVFSGEHDLATKAAVTDLLETLVRGNELVVADFSQAAFVDSAILGVLFQINENAQAQGRGFRLQLGTADIVHRAFEIVGVAKVMDVSSTREAALEDRG